MARPTSKAKLAKEARELLENKALTAIFSAHEHDIIERWRGSDSVEKREACRFELSALEGLRDAIDAAGTE